MACGVLCWAPYVEALVIIDWGLEVWDDIEGRLIMKGIDVESISAEQMIKLLYAAMIDDVLNFEVSRSEARDAVDKEIANQVLRVEARRLAQKNEPQDTVAAPVDLTPDLMYTIGLRPQGGAG